ncbi:hypothetical protein Hanom_Chr11g00987401 [Helianthus anomalus]
MQNYYRVGGLIGSSLSIPTGRGKAVYILPSSDPTFALLLVGFTEYDDDDDDDLHIHILKKENKLQQCYAYIIMVAIYVSNSHIIFMFVLML